MAYARELDSLRQELRQSVTGTIVHWPKVNGANVVGSAVAGEVTFQVYDSSGTSIQGPTNLTPTTVGDVSRFDVSVSAIATLDEDYSVKILWIESGGSTTYIDMVYFDVVLYPFGPPSVSLNDMLEERPDVQETLDRHGQLLGYTAGDTAKETMAAIYAVRARVEMDAMLRAQVALDQANANASPAIHPATQSRYTRPNLILNRERLNRLERKLAMKLVYEGDMAQLEGESMFLYEHYKSAAESAWRGIGPLKYDAAEDLVVDSTLEDVGRVVYQTRAQG